MGTGAASEQVLPPIISDSSCQATKPLGDFWMQHVTGEVVYIYLVHKSVNALSIAILAIFFCFRLPFSFINKEVARATCLCLLEEASHASMVSNFTPTIYN